MYFQAFNCYPILSTLLLLLDLTTCITVSPLRSRQELNSAKTITSVDETTNNPTNTPEKTQHVNGQRLSAYYPVYNSFVQLPSAINYTLYTDLIFFVATTQPNFTVGFGNVNESTWENLAVDFVTRAKSAGVKPRFAVGGWTDSRYFSDLVLTQENRNKYAQSLKTFGIKYGFEGIDIDWEFPSQTGIGCNINRPEDVKNFGLFAAEIKNVWPNAELSAALNVAGIKTSNGSLATADELSLLSQSLDYINIMAYDVYGSWSNTTGPNAPVSAQCSNGDLNGGSSVETGIAMYKTLGFKESQMVLGIPGYGRAFTLESPELKARVVGEHSSMLYQEKSLKVPSGGKTDDKPGVDVCGNKTTASGIWRFQELLENGYLTADGKDGAGGYTRHFDKCSGTPFLVNNTTLISYDDEESTIEKTKYAKMKEVAGIFFFDTEGPSDSLLYASKGALQQRYRN